MSEFTYEYEYNNPRCIIMNGKEKNIALIYYSLENDILWIKDIQKTPIGEQYYNNDYHLGTEILNQLLIHLKENGEFFLKIASNLSVSDAIRGYWHKSIPFYMDFNNYKNSKLLYNLEFKLYDNNNLNKEIVVPTDKNERNVFLDNFIEQHIYDNKEASFELLLSY